jgi:endo-1,4-beta-xylanase
VVKYYRGRVFAWDVLNEAVAGGGRIRQTFWYQNIGPRYLGMVFRWAHQADPNALLFYNDYSCEGLDKKSDGVYDLMKKLVKYKVPIDGIGLQMHLNLDDNPTPEEITANMERLAALGLEIHITEMTVYIRDEVTQEKLDQQADIYRDIMEICLSVDACTAFVMWGFTDRHSHLSDNPNRGSALIFDESYQPKPAYYALVDVLKPEEPNLPTWEPPAWEFHTWEPPSR